MWLCLHLNVYNWTLQRIQWLHLQCRNEDEVRQFEMGLRGMFESIWSTLGSHKINFFWDYVFLWEKRKHLRVPVLFMMTVSLMIIDFTSQFSRSNVELFQSTGTTWQPDGLVSLTGNLQGFSHITTISGVHRERSRKHRLSELMLNGGKCIFD